MSDTPHPRPDLGGFAGEVARASWFSAVGETLSEEEREEARLYLAGLGLTGLRIEAVADWRQAASAAQADDWSPAWWEAEERERRALLDRAEATYQSQALYRLLTDVVQAASDTVHGAAAVAAARGGAADSALLRVAAGAATQAVYQAALAALCGAPGDHPFRAKFRLFAAGRWPLVVAGDRFSLF